MLRLHGHAVVSQFRGGITIHTKDGSLMGNAYIYDVTNENNRPCFHIETDFGNKAKMFIEDLECRFTPGYITDYDRWQRDRMELIGERA